MASERTEQNLRGFFTSRTAEVSSGIRFVCSNMWRQQFNLNGEHLLTTLHVLDRVQVMWHMNLALDEVRRGFQRFGEYTSPEQVMKFLDAWCQRTVRSRIDPMKKIATSLRRPRKLILKWFQD